MSFSEIFFNRHSLSMFPFLLFCFSTMVAGAAIELRDAVPQGYVAAPYYPGRSL